MNNSLKLSKKNNDSRYLSIDGINYEMIGTRKSDESVYIVTLKNLTMIKGSDRFKSMEASHLDKIRKPYKKTKK